MLFIFYIIVLLIFESQINEAKKINCHISKKFASYNYVCPPDSEQKIELEVKPFIQIKMHCRNIESFDDTLLPDLNFGNSLSLFWIYNCSIPKNGFGGILAKLNLKSLEVLQFVWQSSNESFQPEHFKGLERLQELILYSNKITSIDRNLFQHTSNLFNLNLDDNNIKELHDDIFKDLKLLLYLTIVGNQISDLSPNVFRWLALLKELDLRNNEIRHIRRGVFEGLMDLEMLSLSYNKLHRLESGALAPLRNLRYLNMNGNELTNISRKLIENCENLESIDLARNTNLILENNVFSQFAMMSTVTFSYNGLKTISKDLFLASTNLNVIDFQFNNITLLPEYLFRNLKHLQTLWLNNNEINVLHPNLFQNLENLELLDLSNNVIKAVHKNLLRYMKKLKELNLSFNRLKTIESEMLLEKNDLVILLMNNNDLDFTETSLDELGKCKNIKLINFANNSISQFPYRLMKRLVQNVNYRYEYKQVLIDSGVIKINLTSNMIPHVRFDYLFQENVSSGSIAEVDLSYNPIFCDCKASDLVAYTHHLRQPTNIILKYEDLRCAGPSDFKNLAIDKVDENQISCSLNRNCTTIGECDCLYKSVNGTFVVDCSNRNLTDIPGLLIADVVRHYDFITLKRIDVHLEENSLQEGPTEKNGYLNVTKLFLQRNNISTIRWVPPSIEVLNLADNNLDSLDNLVMSMLNESSIKQLHLENNPWKCDCSTDEFHKFLRDHILQVYNATSILCVSLETPLVNMDKSMFCPVKKGYLLVISSLILFCLVTTITTVLFYTIYQKEIFIWLYSRNTCMWLIEEMIDESKKYDAFVSYAHQDEDFVMDELVPALENAEPKYKLCVHIRDWIPGEYITKQIANSVKDSRRTLIILSSDFLKSMWGRMEFRTAHTAAMEEGRVRVIVIIYGDLDITSVTDDLKSYMRTNTYIEWGDPWFWEKLRYALPRRRHRHIKPKRKRGRNSDENGIELH